MDMQRKEENLVIMELSWDHRNEVSSNEDQLTAVQRRLGEYWRSREARSIASGGIRLWKTWSKKHYIKCKMYKNTDRKPISKKLQLSKKPFQLNVRVFHSPSTLPKISWFCANVWKMYMGWHPASITYLLVTYYTLLALDPKLWDHIVLHSLYDSPFS